MGRRLSPKDFGTFAALLGVLLALSGPATALLGGAAMSSARSGRIALPRWRAWILFAGVALAILGLIPLPTLVRSGASLVEHLDDPAAVFRTCHRALRPGGILYLVTPNAGSGGLRVFGESWWNLEDPTQVRFFTPPSARPDRGRRLPDG
jgi:SAM-dependent methyltransferase